MLNLRLISGNHCKVICYSYLAICLLLGWDKEIHNFLLVYIIIFVHHSNQGEPGWKEKKKKKSFVVLLEEHSRANRYVWEPDNLNWPLDLRLGDLCLNLAQQRDAVCPRVLGEHTDVQPAGRSHSWGFRLHQGQLSWRMLQQGTASPCRFWVGSQSSLLRRICQFYLYVLDTQSRWLCLAQKDQQRCSCQVASDHPRHFLSFECVSHYSFEQPKASISPSTCEVGCFASTANA